MTMAFSLILAAGILIGFCILICIVHISYKIAEARRSPGLMDTEFPVSTGYITKKSVRSNEDVYTRATSNTRIAMGYFYSDSDIESLRRRNPPQKLPKGR